MQRRIARSAIGPVTGTVRSVKSTLPYPSKRCKKYEIPPTCGIFAKDLKTIAPEIVNTTNLTTARRLTMAQESFAVASTLSED